MNSLKEVKSIDEIDWEKLELQRGETREDTKDKCLQYCKDYLGDNWLSQTVDSIEVQRVSGGLTNQLYCCRIAEPSDTSDVPQEVAVRLYGAKHINVEDEKNERLTDVIVSLMVSENGLGPKVYGIFEEGQILKYYKHNIFNVEEQKDPVLVKEAFEKLAKIHAMRVPIKKSGDWLLTEFDRLYQMADKRMNSGMIGVIREANCQLILDNDLKIEINWIKELIEKSGSPLVFTHNDFRSSNIMVLKDSENNNVQSDEKLVLCDFEYASYGYRGTDFGYILAEWGRNWNELYKKMSFPGDNILRHLLGIYLEECRRLLGDTFTESAVNSMEHLMSEAKLFTMSGNLVYMLMFLGDAMKEAMPLDDKCLAQLAEGHYKEYFYLKDRFTKEETF